MNDEMRTTRIEALIAAYGSDVNRWPAAERAHAPAQADLEGVAGAADATALDCLLDEAGRQQPEPAPDALIAAILAKARADDAPAPSEGKTGLSEGASSGVVPLAVGAGMRSGATRPSTIYRAPAAAAALMAASLAVGLFVGSLPTTQSTVAQIGTLAGLDLGSTTAIATFEDDFLAQDEEDIL